MKSLKIWPEKSANRAVLLGIRLYQNTFSPDHGPLRNLFGYSRCKFFPSCSEYAVSAIRQYGLLRGGVVSCKRFLRCLPWGAGGYDPVN